MFHEVKYLGMSELACRHTKRIWSLLWSRKLTFLVLHGCAKLLKRFKAEASILRWWFWAKVSGEHCSESAICTLTVKGDYDVPLQFILNRGRAQPYVGGQHWLPRSYQIAISVVCAVKEWKCLWTQFRYTESLYARGKQIGEQKPHLLTL